MMADASTISGSSSIATKPEPLFCDDDVFAAVLVALPVFTDVVADVDADAPEFRATVLPATTGERI